MNYLLKLIIIVLISIFPASVIFKEIQYREFNPSTDPGILHVYTLETNKFKLEIKNESDSRILSFTRNGQIFDILINSAFLDLRINKLLDKTTLVDVNQFSQEILFNNSTCEFLLIKIPATQLNATYTLNKNNKDNIFLSTVYDIECVDNISNKLIENLFLE